MAGWMPKYREMKRYRDMWMLRWVVRRMDAYIHIEITIHTSIDGYMDGWM